MNSPSRQSERATDWNSCVTPPFPSVLISGKEGAENLTSGSQKAIPMPDGGYRPYTLKNGGPAEVRLPQVLAYALVATELGAPALRLALAITTVSYQFNHEAEAFHEISYSEFERLTHLQRMGVRRAIAELEERRIIDVVRGAGRGSSSYRLRAPDDWCYASSKARPNGLTAFLAEVTRSDHHPSHHVTTGSHTPLPLPTPSSTTTTVYKQTSTSRPMMYEVEHPAVQVASNRYKTENEAQGSFSNGLIDSTKRDMTVLPEIVVAQNGRTEPELPYQGPRTLRELRMKLAAERRAQGIA